MHIKEAIQKYLLPPRMDAIINGAWTKAIKGTWLEKTETTTDTTPFTHQYDRSKYIVLDHCVKRCSCGRLVKDEDKCT